MRPEGDRGGAGVKLNLGPWASYEATGPFAYANEPSFAGISGGRTSAMMAALLDPRVILCFENTGREDEKSLEFLLRLADALKRPITWLEWRPPVRRGAPPKEFQFAIVDDRTCQRRSGALFEGLLDALAAYRATKGEGPIVPHPTLRICTAYLKHRVQQAYRRALGVADSIPHVEYVGLRADEPGRVSRLRVRETQARTYGCPLSEALITKGDVGRFWRQQPFDLEIEHDRNGNCGACFLKDHADQSRVLGEPETDAAWWIAIQKKYPGFGGRNHPGYAQLLLERPVRLAIAEALTAGTDPMLIDGSRLGARRFKQVVTNEKRYAAGEAEAFSCACESSLGIGEEDEDAA